MPFVQSGNLLFTAGPAAAARTASCSTTGLLGRDVDIAAGKEAAKLCAINMLAQAKAALGDLDSIARIVKITVFVASAPDFTEQHLVANGASDFLVAALGDERPACALGGRHGRAAAQRAGRDRSHHRNRRESERT